ncbi:MAG TPA: hypothetical protein VGB17_08800 [Pyrinomonadaceae bacterium]|jgi:hypothetical protein
MGKLTESFAPALFFRIIIPGLVLAIGLHPFAHTILEEHIKLGAYPVDGNLLFISEIIFLGLITYAATNRLHSIAEGTKLPYLTIIFYWWNKRRLRRQSQRLYQLYLGEDSGKSDAAAKREILKLTDYLNDFPVEVRGGVPTYQIYRHTRLGNIIASYQSYTISRYRIDDATYWHHIRYRMPSDVRGELGGLLSTAEGTVLALVCGWIILLIVLLTEAARQIQVWWPSLAIGQSPIPDSLLRDLLLYAAFIIVLFNFLARETHRLYGKHFRAAFDTHVNSFMEWLKGHHTEWDETLLRKHDALMYYLIYLNEMAEEFAKEDPEAKAVSSPPAS